MAPLWPALTMRLKFYVVLIAKLGRGGKVRVRYIGRYIIGKLNDRNDRRAAVAETNKLFVATIAC